MKRASQMTVRWSKQRTGRFAAWCAVALLVSPICVHSASAQLTLTGGNLTLVQEGPAAALAGDPAPANLATGAVPFASSDLGPELGVAFHVAANLNDGTYGNSYSWIGGDTNPYPIPFAGIDLGASAVSSVQSIALGRSNVLAGFTDRHLGLYTLQYTQVPSPSTNLGLATTGDALTGWVDVGTLDYGASDGPGTNYNNTWQRHRFNFDSVDATGVRLIVPSTGLGGGVAIDEIELYDVAGEYVPPPPPPDPITITSAAGFSISWDGNDGDFFDEQPPPDGAIVPENAALASGGAAAFSSSDLGPQLGVDFHVAANLNDGFYGNSNSWIGGDENPFPEPFVGVDLGSPQPVTRIAWGRDNGNGAWDDSNPGTDACGGQCDDRWVGTFTLQFTQVAGADQNTTVTEDATTGWATMGTIELGTLSTDDGPGGKYTGYLRHAFDVLHQDQPVLASGIRLVVPATGLNGGTAIDELEVYVIPEPASLTLGLLGFLALMGRRRRTSPQK